MDDPELEAIRQQRMAQLSSSETGGVGAPMMSQEQAQAQAEAAAAAAEQRSALLAAVLTPEARARLARVALVKPEKARGVEDAVLSAARRGTLASAVDEEGLMELLDRFGASGGGGGGGVGGFGGRGFGGGGGGGIGSSKGGPRITIARRKSVLDDDD